MGTTLHDAEAVCPEFYVSLGLSTSCKGVPEFPRVLSLLSSYLETTILKTEKSLASMEAKEKFTVFHGLRAPNLCIKKYMERIFKYSKCSPSCFVLAHVYIDRFLRQPDIHLTSHNVHRLLITSVVVAAKFIDDAFFNNAYYAKVGGISTSEMNRLEEAKEYHVERPIKICGFHELSSTEEAKCLAVRRYSCGAI